MDKLKNVQLECDKGYANNSLKAAQKQAPPKVRKEFKDDDS